MSTHTVSQVLRDQIQTFVTAMLATIDRLVHAHPGSSPFTLRACVHLETTRCNAGDGVTLDVSRGKNCTHTQGICSSSRLRSTWSYERRRPCYAYYDGTAQRARHSASSPSLKLYGYSHQIHCIRRRTVVTHFHTWLDYNV